MKNSKVPCNTHFSSNKDIYKDYNNILYKIIEIILLGGHFHRSKFDYLGFFWLNYICSACKESFIMKKNVSPVYSSSQATSFQS